MLPRMVNSSAPSFTSFPRDSCSSCRATSFAATVCRIHDNPKPVQNRPCQSPAKPQGREEPFFQPPVAASTTSREASPAHNMQSLPTQPTTKRNHCFRPVNHLPPDSPANPRGRNETQEQFFQPPVAESTTIPSQFEIFQMTEINHLSPTDCRIHYHPKPVKILPRYSPTKPQGRSDREQPFLLPPIAESTTIPRQ